MLYVHNKFLRIFPPYLLIQFYPLLEISIQAMMILFFHRVTINVVSSKKNLKNLNQARLVQIFRINWSSDMVWPSRQRISGISDLKRVIIHYLIWDYFRPNEDPNEVNAVEVILKDIIDVSIYISHRYSTGLLIMLKKSYFNLIRSVI
jgi:hypothetical protein